MLHLHREVLVVISVIVGFFGGALVLLAVCLNGSTWFRRCSCCRNQQHNPRQFESLNELLLELEDDETGVLIHNDNDRRERISIDSFFPDILMQPKQATVTFATAIDEEEVEFEECLI